ncbi:transcriptional regulator, LuxR family, putative [Minicystis rosea]|nr:transcriptional regulator, LuxR family, putative [Minicystis rosea]
MGSPRRRRDAPTNVFVDDGPQLVGRVNDRAGIAALFNEGARLVSVVGPGGMGKTRLATSFAAEQVEAYAGFGDGGVWFCDLTPARTITAFAAGLAEALGVQLGATEDAARLLEQVGKALQRRGRVLVVLDNFEELAPFAAATVGVLLRAAPRARFLVTTRVALDLPDEHRWPLQGLALPKADATSAALLLGVESIDLFVRRARQVRPELDLDEASVAAIADLVARLDGIPLALELAAARVAALSPVQIRDRLAEGRADLLSRPRDGGRHASMRGVVAESFRLLDDRARDCLLMCAIFRGGFTLEALDAMAAHDGSADASALAPLEALCAHSLVRISARAEPGGAPRFSLYEVIREFAEAELAAHPALSISLALRHARHFASVARAHADRPLHDIEARLAIEVPNLHRAHATAAAAARAEGGAQAVEDALLLALAIHAVSRPRGLLAPCLAVLDEALAAARAADATTSARFAEALIVRGALHADRGDFEAAARDLDEGLALARACDAGLEARALMARGAIVEARGATEAAREAYTEALACARRAPVQAIALAREAEARACLAHAHRREGRLAAADMEIAAAIEAFRALGDENGLAAMIHEAGVVALFRERHDEAAARFDDALARARRRQARQREAAVLTAQGTLVQEQGQLDRASDLHEAAVALYREVGHVYGEASTLYYLAGCHLERGQREDADAVLGAALALVRTVGVPRYEALMLGAQATIAADAGRSNDAHEILAAADAAAAPCGSEPTLLATIAIHRLHVRLATDASALPAESRAALVAEARALAAAHACDDPRFAYRVLVRSAARAADPGPAAAPALIVRADGKGFQIPGAARDVDLSRRVPLARLVHVLARHRIEAPGEPLRVEDLLAAGWPGERIRYDAGVNRVYVALAELRKLGLRDWMITDASGYRLVTTHPVVLERPAA